MFDQKYIDDLNELLSHSDELEFINDEKVVDAIQTLYDSLEYLPTCKYQHYSYTFEEARDLLFEVFDRIDPMYKDKVLEAINNKDQYIFRIIFDPKHELYGVNKCGSGPNYTTEVIITYENSPKGVLTAGHECAHAIGNRSKYNVRPDDDCIGEIESLFTEHLIADVLLQMGAITQEEYDSLQNESVNNLKKNCEIALERVRLLKNLTLPVTKEQLEELVLSLEDEPNKESLLKRLQRMPTDRRSAPYVYRYIVGEVVSSKLYRRYQDDREDTMDRFYVMLENNVHYKLDDVTDWFFKESPEETFKSYLRNIDKKR